MQKRREIGRVIVTGAASGLGKAIAAAVEDAGGTPICLDLNETEGYESHRIDLADAAATEATIRAIGRDHGSIDAIVNAAGVDSCGPLETVPGEQWNRVIAVNLIGTAAVIRAALEFLAADGRIVNVASTLGVRALPEATAYCASKFGVVGFTRALAAELTGRAKVTLLIPGGMETSFFEGREQKYKPPPDAVLAAPRDVANTVVFSLTRPPGVELRELLVCPPNESSWP